MMLFEKYFRKKNNYMPLSKLNFSRVKTTFFFALIVLLALAMLYLMQPFFYPIFWAAVIAVMFYPLYKKFLKTLKSPNISSVLTLICVFFVLLLPLSVVSFLLINESLNLYELVSEKSTAIDISDVASRFDGTVFEPLMEKAKTEWTTSITNATKQVSLFVFNGLKSFTQNSVRFVFMLFIMFYSLFFFLKDGRAILQHIMHLSPLGDTYEEMLYERFTSTTRATLKSTLIIGGIQGILGGVLFAITGIPGALVWGVVMIALSVIPAVGSFVIWLPTGLIMLALGNTWQGLTIILVGIFVISTIDNLLRPPLIGKDIQMHPLLVLLSTLGGIALFGISGFVIGPVIAALFLSIMTIYDHYYKTELTNN